MKNKYANHFVNLEELIYAPLYSVAQSNIQLSGNIMDLIASTGNTAPSDEKDTIHLKTVNLAYEQINNDGMDGKVIEEVGLKIPLISIVPITNLQVSKTKIAFDAEIKKTKKDKKTNQCIMEARICSREKQRRKENGLSKISFEIELESAPVPEGMARFIDILNANPIPETLSSRQINENGEIVTGDRAVYYQQVKSLKSQETKLKLTGEKLLGLIAAKKLDFDRLLRGWGMQCTFDTLFSTDEDKNMEALKSISEGLGMSERLIKLYQDIRDAENTYQKIMDQVMELSDRRMRAELAHIREEIENG